MKSSDKHNKDKVSVIVPLYNEAKNIGVLYCELIEVLEETKQEYEIILIDDKSTDTTSQALNELYDNDNKGVLKVISFARKCGQTQAIQAGIDKSQGSVVALIDGDLQNNPKDIPHLLDALGQGWDLVNGWRKSRKDSLFVRRMPSLIANALIRFFTKVDLHDFGCALKVFKKDVLREIPLLGSMHRLLPLYVALRGGRVTEVVVDHRKRIHGRSKYGLSRTYELFLELLRIHFFQRHFSSPLYYFGISAVILIIIGIALGLFVFMRKLLFGGIWISPLFFISIILFFLGVQAFFMGIVAEILVRISLQNKSNKLYVIREFKG